MAMPGAHHERCDPEEPEHNYPGAKVPCCSRRVSSPLSPLFARAVLVTESGVSEVFPVL